MSNYDERPDELNPNLMFQTIATELLVKIVSGEVDASQMVAKEMASRGVDKNGTWVGFEEAARIHGVVFSS